MTNWTFFREIFVFRT